MKCWWGRSRGGFSGRHLWGVRGWLGARLDVPEVEERLSHGELAWFLPFVKATQTPTRRPDDASLR
jgi:hypothetical protein